MDSLMQDKARMMANAKNRPKNTKINQQSFRTFRPQYTLTGFLLLNICIFIVCGSISATLYLLHLNEWEMEIDYTECIKTSENICILNFTITETIEGGIDFYYGLDGFYQSNREYLRSRSDQQLNGKIDNTYGCDSYTNTHSIDKKARIVPCGAMADSMFNDSFTIYAYGLAGSKLLKVPFITKFDEPYKYLRKNKYSNPRPCYDKNNVCPGFEDTSKPLSWKIPIEELGKSSDNANGDNGYALENFDFIVWMEPAMLPKFRKPYRQLKQNSLYPAQKPFSEGLKNVQYFIQIRNNYPVYTLSSKYSIRKKFIIVKQTVLGGEGRGGAKFAALFQSIGFGVISVLSIFLCIMGIFEKGAEEPIR